MGTHLALPFLALLFPEEAIYFHLAVSSAPPWPEAAACLGTGYL